MLVSVNCSATTYCRVRNVYTFRNNDDSVDSLVKMNGRSAKKPNQAMPKFYMKK